MKISDAKLQGLSPKGYASQLPFRCRKSININQHAIHGWSSLKERKENDHEKSID